MLIKIWQGIAITWLVIFATLSNAQTVSIRPTSPSSITPLQVVAAVSVCSSVDVLSIVNHMNVSQAGSVIGFMADLAPETCAPQESLQTKLLTFTIDRLLPGSYNLNYVRSKNGVVDATESLAFTVAPAPDGPAIIPVDGMWWDPSQSGTGYSVVVRHGTLLMTIYSYAPNGAAQWYLLIGQLTNNSATGTLQKFSVGQCISCSVWQIPIATGDDGTATVTFTSPTTATMMLPGGRITHLVPQDF